MRKKEELLAARPQPLNIDKRIVIVLGRAPDDRARRGRDERIRFAKRMAIRHVPGILPRRLLWDVRAS